MHNSHQSFASRQRMLDRDGDAANQAIWFSERIGTNTPMLPTAFEVIDEWLANIRERPWRGVSRQPPPERAQDACFDASTATIAAARTCGPAPSTTAPPARACSASRSTRPPAWWRAGRSAEASTSARCGRSPSGRARSLRRLDASIVQRARLEQIFPTGVCDYTRPDQGRP